MGRAIFILLNHYHTWEEDKKKLIFFTDEYILFNVHVINGNENMALIFSEILIECIPYP